MFKVNVKGPWRPLRGLLKNYDKRIAYVRRVLGKDVAEAFLAELRKRAPQGEEYVAYLNSLEVVELTGSKGGPAFGVIARNKKVTIGDIRASGMDQKTVVYIEPSSTRPSAMGELISGNNPWPVELLPNGMKKSELVLIHQLVTEGEYKYARAETMSYISSRRAEFRREGMQWGKLDQGMQPVEGMESLPDWMSLAIRSEFGINARPVPHWRPTLRWVEMKVKEFWNKDDNIRKALFDPLFREHTIGKKGDMETMDVADFQKQVGAFQKSVVG